MNIRTLLSLVTIVVFSAAPAAPGLLGDEGFDLSRHTIDGGGAMRSTGGEFELSGTIGQPDAGPGATGMTGGDLQLVGGFWFRIPLGDCEDDGDVDLMDHKKLATVPCLTGPLGGPPVADCRCFDINRDGTVDMADVAVIQSTYTGP